MDGRPKLRNMKNLLSTYTLYGKYQNVDSYLSSHRRESNLLRLNKTLNCPICKPNRGCNKSRRYFGDLLDDNTIEFLKRPSWKSLHKGKQWEVGIGSSIFKKRTRGNYSYEFMI